MLRRTKHEMSTSVSDSETNPKAQSKRPTSWHAMFAMALQKMYTAVGIGVQPEVRIGALPPEIDVVLRRNPDEPWTEEQVRVLADGIRDSTASHILLEFKY